MPCPQPTHLCRSPIWPAGLRRRRPGSVGTTVSTEAGTTWDSSRSRHCATISRASPATGRSTSGCAAAISVRSRPSDDARRRRTPPPATRSRCCRRTATYASRVRTSRSTSRRSPARSSAARRRWSPTRRPGTTPTGRRPTSTMTPAASTTSRRRRPGRTSSAAECSTTSSSRAPAYSGRAPTSERGGRIATSGARRVWNSCSTIVRRRCPTSRRLLADAAPTSGRVRRSPRSASTALIPRSRPAGLTRRRQARTSAVRPVSVSATTRSSTSDRQQPTRKPLVHGAAAAAAVRTSTAAAVASLSSSASPSSSFCSCWPSDSSPVGSPISCTTSKPQALWLPKATLPRARGQDRPSQQHGSR